ncbi:HNH endonuclease [Culicoidibacter larvae]|uniref:Putative HNH nuclease YajD n=1 Tax=Culicoidibacter larvae TaxID=2579976 RepID=A0A5R8QAZ2_9FIRM|nr:HNH endonuclease signature motif containing protein [Culicoidibacter larvae]TLG72060.1 HNH endonuclease [Culicoidibacter larvae]
MNNYKTKEQKLKFYKSKAWKQLRLVALERDNNECQQCKANGVYHKAEDVDHVKEIENYPQLALDINNLRCLCKRCHNAKHDRFVKRESKWNDERW